MNRLVSRTNDIVKCIFKSPILCPQNKNFLQKSSPLIWNRSIHCTKQSFSSYRQQLDAAKLTKDVIVYKYNNPRFFKILNIFAIVQFGFWTYVADLSFSELRDTPVDENQKDLSLEPFYKQFNLGSDRFRYSMAAICTGFGLATVCFSWFYTLRSVRYLILTKGGTSVSVVCYGPLGTNRIYNVPLRNICAVQIREATPKTVPIKIKGQSFYFLLDGKGEYVNPELFDRIINVKRFI